MDKAAAAKAEILTLRTVPSLGPEITLSLSMLEAVRAQTKDTVAGMSDEELLWPPMPGMRCVAAMLRHVAATELYWIRECFGGTSAPPELWRECGWSVETRAELPLPPAPLASWLATLDRVRHETVRMLEITKDAALDSNYVHPLREDQACQGRWILYHVLEHEAYHRGQMAAVRGMLKRARREGT